MIFQSYRTIRNGTNQSYTWSSFLKEVSPRELVERLENSATRFARGFPPHTQLQDVSISRVFQAVLCKGYVTDSDFTTDDEKRALMECFRNGWLHTDRLHVIGRPNEVGYFFSSSLHHWYVEWKLLDTIPAILFDTPNIMDLVVDIIHMFSPRALSTKRSIGPGYVQRPPEAQYQDEFYRCCHSVSKGSLVTFPEFGTKWGRVDFYIPSKQWGVELLRNGDGLEQHSGRFSQTGSYGTSLTVSDYIILDCRTTYPMKSHPREIFVINFGHRFTYLALPHL